MDIKNTNGTSQVNNFPPVVSVLGHVDHGKTSLLDAIRKTQVADREHGGITQRIGASSIEIKHEGKTRHITFIDTPGHEAFFTMRAQGVNASDVALLVVAADDGIKPQTKESIEKILEAKIPYIVVITKIDLETAQIEKVKGQLTAAGVLLEGLGGEVPYIGVSAKTGDKIQDLLDLIVLVYDMAKVEKDASQPFMGVVIDAKLDKRRGAVATIIVKQGTLNSSSKVYVGKNEVGKTRALFDSLGKSVKQATPGDAVEILGLMEVLLTGSIIFDKPMTVEKVAEVKKAAPANALDLAAFFKEEEKENIGVILKAETSGEMDALKSSMPADIRIVGEGQGDISVADVLLAKDFHALILGFNVDIAKDAKILADNEHVFYKTYTIIYKLLDEVGDAVNGLIQEEKADRILGRSEIIAQFPGKTDKILGVKVLEGRLALNDRVKIMHGETLIGESKITFIRRGKSDVKEVAKNLECGVTITPFIDFEIGDMLLSCSQKRSA